MNDNLPIQCGAPPGCLASELRGLRVTLWSLFPAFIGLAITAPQTRAADGMSALVVIQRAEERFRRLQDYECTVDMESKLGKKVEGGTCQFWFKQPRMMRVKVLRGAKKGSQVAVDRTGQIRGSKGGILGLIVRRMKSNDSRLLTIRGTSLMTLDWGSCFLKYHAAILRPDAGLSLAPHPDPSAPWQVVVAYPNLGKSMREIYWIDPQQWVIVEGAVYEDEVRIEHVVFREIKLDTGKADSWFRL